MSTNIENLLKIGPVSFEIFGGICRFLPYRPKFTVSTLMRFGSVIPQTLVIILKNNMKIYNVRSQTLSKACIGGV